MIKIKRGLDLPISGRPEQVIYDGPTIRTVALVGSDYVGIKPSMQVQAGDRVRKGQLLFIDKKNPDVRFTAPGTGVVATVHRGAKRVFQSLVIELDAGSSEQETFKSWPSAALAGLDRATVQDNLVASGAWTSLRTRPFSKVPAPGTVPHSLFVTAMDTNPLAADAAVVIGQDQQAFDDGLAVLSHLTDGKVYVCQAPGRPVTARAGGQLVVETFDGPHPAGLAGTHINALDPVSTRRTVWYIDYQDVIAVGKLFTTGEIAVDRVVALAGPVVENPRLLRTRTGASTDELTAGQLRGGHNRVVAGSILNGNTARGSMAFLGRYHRQVVALAEGTDRPFLGWLTPGADRFSLARIYVSQFAKGRTFDFNTNTNGSPRAMVPIGAYEKVVPLDILPTQLLRSLIVGDIEVAQQLAVLQLDEEDVALCTYVCPGKYDYGPILRENLTRIEKET